MTRFLLTAMPFSGHVTLLIALAAELRRRGHPVRVYTGKAFRERVAVMITDGGWGGTLRALAQRIPLVVAGGELGKPAVVAGVAFAEAELAGGPRCRRGHRRRRGFRAARRAGSPRAR